MCQICKLADWLDLNPHKNKKERRRKKRKERKTGKVELNIYRKESIKLKHGGGGGSHL